MNSSNPLAEHVEDPDHLLTTLDAIFNCFAEAWPEGHLARQRISALRERLSSTTLNVAVVGQFKRGKSTFINALLGSVYLPTSVVPLTAVPTFIAWGASPRARVSYQDQRSPVEFRAANASEICASLFRFATEDGNPLNYLQVARVELFAPADVLRSGIVLIDTPGIGSTFKHNNVAALQTLPECDAAIFVTSADPPITEAEIAYLAMIRQHVARTHFVLNKIDYLSTQELGASVSFAQRTLDRALGANEHARIFLLSARQAMDARLNNDEAALERSGLNQLARELLPTLAHDKSAALRASVRQKAGANLDMATLDIKLKIQALELPLEDLERRSLSLEQTLRKIQIERRVAQDLLEGDRRRAIMELEVQAEQLRSVARSYLGDIVRQTIDKTDGQIVRSAIQRALEVAIPGFFQQRLGELAVSFHRSVEALLTGHQARADTLVVSVRHTAAALFDLPLPEADDPEPFHLGPQPYWVTERLASTMLPSPAGIVSRVLPKAWRQRRSLRQVEDDVCALVQHNVENLRWATLRGLNDTFLRFSQHFDERLADAVAASQGAIGKIITRGQDAVEEAASELAQLHELVGRFSQLQERLAAAVAGR